MLERAPLEAQCNDCEGHVVVDRFCCRCPTCWSDDVRILGGEELVLESVTLDVTGD